MDKHISLQAVWQREEEAMVLGSLLPLVNVYCVPNIKAFYEALNMMGESLSSVGPGAYTMRT